MIKTFTNLRIFNHLCISPHIYVHYYSFDWAYTVAVVYVHVHKCIHAYIYVHECTCVIAITPYPG